MSQSKSAAKVSESESQQLSAQIESLKNDIAAISQTLVDIGSNRREAVVSDASKKVAHLRDRGEQQMQEAQAKVEEMTKQATDAVRNQPATAVGIAVGVGFLLGFLSGRK